MSATTWLWWLLSLLIIAAILAAALAAAQLYVHRSIFQPWALSRATPADDGYLRVGASIVQPGYLRVGASIIATYKVLPKRDICIHTTVLFLPGNAYDIGFYLEHCKSIADATGLPVRSLEYPGYGRSTGSPSKESILEASLAVLRSCEGPVVLYGMSLGTHVALALARTRRASVSRICLDGCVPILGDAVVRGGYSGPLLAPVVAWLMKGYFDLRGDLEAVAASGMPVAAVHRDYDHFVTIDDFQMYVAPHCQVVDTVRAGHTWPIYDAPLLRRLLGIDDSCSRV